MNAHQTPQPFIVGIAGGSGSGKTTFSRKVVGECRKAGISGTLAEIMVDNAHPVEFGTKLFRIT